MLHVTYQVQARKRERELAERLRKRSLDIQVCYKVCELLQMYKYIDVYTYTTIQVNIRSFDI